MMSYVLKKCCVLNGYFVRFRDVPAKVIYRVGEENIVYRVRKGDISSKIKFLYIWYIELLISRTKRIYFFIEYF